MLGKKCRLCLLSNIQSYHSFIDGTTFLTFFMMPVLRLLKVVYRLSLFSINSILIFTLPLVFFPGLRPVGDTVWPGFCPAPWKWTEGVISPSESSSPSKFVGSTFSKMKLSGCAWCWPGPFVPAKPSCPFNPAMLAFCDLEEIALEWLPVCMITAKEKYLTPTALFRAFCHKREERLTHLHVSTHKN